MNSRAFQFFLDQEHQVVSDFQILFQYFAADLTIGPTFQSYVELAYKVLYFDWSSLLLDPECSLDSLSLPSFTEILALFEMIQIFSPFRPS